MGGGTGHVCMPSQGTSWDVLVKVVLVQDMYICMPTYMSDLVLHLMLLLTSVGVGKLQGAHRIVSVSYSGGLYINVTISRHQRRDSGYRGGW